MDFTINTDSLQKAIKVLGVVVRANSADASGRILIEATNDGKVIFMANNGCTAVTFDSNEAKVNKPGVVSVTYSKIKSFVFSYRPWYDDSGVKEFRFILDNKNVKITVENFYAAGEVANGELKLTSFNPALVTKLPVFGDPNFKLNSKIFRQATEKVLYAINPQLDFSQPSLQGMSIMFEGDDIFFVGSNGIVLSEYNTHLKSKNSYDGNLILQYDFIMGLRRLVNDDIELYWSVNDHGVCVKFNEIVFVGRRIIGHDFPEYKPSLDNYTDYIRLDKEFFVGALQPFIDILDPDDNYRLTIEVVDKLFKIFNDCAKIEAKLDIIGGLNFSIDLNGKYLIQTVEAIKDENILFKFSTPESFAIFDSCSFNNQKALISSINKR